MSAYVIFNYDIQNSEMTITTNDLHNTVASQVAMITGGGRGFGRAFAIALAGAGVAVAVVALSGASG